jgi:hypothetical protein
MVQDLKKYVDELMVELKTPRHFYPIRAFRIGAQKKLVLVELSAPGAALELVRRGKNLRGTKFRDIFIERKKSQFNMWYERRMVVFKLDLEKTGEKVRRTGNGLLIGEQSAGGTNSGANEPIDNQVFIPATEFAGNSVFLRGMEYILHDPPGEWDRPKVTEQMDCDASAPVNNLKRKPSDRPLNNTSPVAEKPIAKRNKDNLESSVDVCCPVTNNTN